MAKKDYVKLKFKGGKEIAKDLERMGKEAGAAVALREMENVWKGVEHHIRNNAPTDTGALKESITLTSKRDTRGLRVGVTVGKSGKRGKTRTGDRKPVYAIQTEFGTEDTPEQPFIRPAFDGREDILLRKLLRRLNATILKWKNINNNNKG